MDDPATQLSILQSFSICEAKESLDWNICCTWAYWESLLRQKAKDLATVIDHKAKQLAVI